MTRRPSLRLRLLNLGMRLFAKPSMRGTAEPETANVRFERVAPYIFSAPNRLVQTEEAGMPVMAVGVVPSERIVMFIHGGAFVTGSSRSYRAFAGRLAQRAGVKVAVPDYPLLQQASYPAAPQAVLAAWDCLIRAGYRAENIALAGDSAGGNLVFGLLSVLLQRGERPACVVGFSPWTDLTLSGDSLITNAARDPLLPVSRMQEVVGLYLCGADASQPIASPLFADFPNPPPILVQVGAEEILLSDAERIAHKTGARLEVWPDCPHVWQMFDPRLPEAREAMRQAGDFIQTSLESASRKPTASAT